MKSWMQERDRLIAETNAFVQAVAASTRRLVKAQTAAQVQEARQPIRLEPEQAEAPPKPIASLTPLARMDERAEIAKRIASFKAHQARFSEDREKFFRSVMTKIKQQRSSADFHKK